MTKLGRVTWALLAMCMLSAKAEAGGAPPILQIDNLSCSIPGACSFVGTTTGTKTFSQPGPIALTGTVAQFGPGPGAVTPMFIETISNQTTLPFTAFSVALSSEFSDTIATILGVEPLNGVEPLLTFASFFSDVDVGTCGLSNTVTVSCSGLNVMPQAAFDVAFTLAAPVGLAAPVAFSLAQTPTQTSAVPEPGILALLGLALASLVASRRPKQ